MQGENMQKVRDVLLLSAQILGVAKIGLIPSPRLVSSAYSEISQMKDKDGNPSFPIASQRLKEIDRSFMPSQQGCRQACDEVIQAFRQINAQMRSEKMEQAAHQMRPGLA